MIGLLLVYFIIYFTYLIAILFFSITRRTITKGKSTLQESPFISILVAARNEETNIVSCLNALSKLDYPKDKIEILIGDDNSEDSTYELVKKYKEVNPNVNVFRINDNLGNAKGKANVLAHLARYATSDYFFITDADIEVSASWIKGIFKEYSHGDGIISGVTIVKGNELFAKMQALEWIFAFGMVKVVSDLNIPVSAVGNNMMIPRKVYQSTGGYETIPFSVTEDFELFRQTLLKGYNFKNLLNSEVLAFTKPISSLSALLQQRKRWMSGAFQLPLLLQTCLLLQSFFLPFILCLVWFYPVTGFIIWIMKILLQNTLIAMDLKRLKWGSELLKYALVFEIYTGVVSVVLFVNYLLPSKIVWKGRKY